ncbi:MAG: EamA family transporter [Planctomycetes bacterium]|nr:EamA family transporter [Planctomycetota bacterium]
MSASDDSDPKARSPSTTTIVVLVALLCLVWGSTWFVIGAGLRDLPPFTSAAIRFVVAAAIMTALAPVLSRKEGGTKPPFIAWFWVGLLNFGASYAIVYWSETHIPSGLTSVLWSVFPMMMAVSGTLFLAGEKLRARQGVGFVLGFAGVALLFATDLRALSAETVTAGLVLLLSPLVSAVGTTIQKKHGGQSSSVLMNRNAMWVGALVLCTLAVVLERDAPSAWTASALGSIAYLSVFGTALTFSLYFWLLRHIAAYRLSMIAYITPAIALTIGTLVGKEPLTEWTVLGSLTILVGVALVVVRPRLRRTS